MKVFSIALPITLLLILCGCGEKVAGSKVEAAASAVPAVTVKELTPEEKFAETKRKAEAGDAEAQFNLGKMYHNGEGVVKDTTQAIEWLQKSAVQGNANAQYAIGNNYMYGYGLPLDTVKAMELFQKSAAQGNTDSLNAIGSMYSSGQGVPKDAVKAIEWFRKAAVQGNAYAQLNLGGMYYRGEGTYKNAAEAAEWYQKAAEQNNMFAQYYLGQMHAQGEGVLKNTAKAIELIQKAAAQGYADAQFSMGVLYTHSEGVPFGITLDKIRAYAWFNLASERENKNAKIWLANIEAELTPAQRAEGQRLASNWKKGDVIPASTYIPLGSASPDGKPTNQGTGTAFIVSSEGHALTNHHVVNGCAEVKIAGHEGIVKVIISDSVNDLALLQLPGKPKDIASLNPDPGKLRQGEEIIVFGYPLNSVLSSGGNLTPGIISAMTGLENNTNQIQITAPIQGGSSGSPVMDKKGDVVGVVSSRLDMKAVRATGSIPQNVNFAVNGQTAKAFLDANKVSYKTGGGLFSREKSNADIAEEARKWTVLVECWK